jgi:HEAT repeat protein
MDIHEIETMLNQSDFQYRLQAISALKDYDSEVAVPLMIGKINDPEFLVRSFVARGLGKQQTPESFAALLEIMKFDNTPNVRAEAANSLSFFGTVAASHLVLAFDRDDHWLVRRSILAALVEMNCPYELFEMCDRALADEEPTVRESAIDALGSLSQTTQRSPALELLLKLVNAALARLRQDTDSKVVGAALENLLS